MKEYHAIGVMSGTSLDGLDICLTTFRLKKKVWSYELRKAVTIPYPASWRMKLIEARNTWGIDIVNLHFEYGEWIGKQVRQFMRKTDLVPLLVASHGHTVLHRPDLGISVQIGDGPSLAREAGLTTVWNFRHRDVALGGQGAPLVPIGDELLFPQYDYCLNLGGFSNISYINEKRRVAFDICPVNILLNRISQQYWNEPFDQEGSLGSQGKVDNELLFDLNILPYYRSKPPKSLGMEWLEENISPLLKHYRGKPEDLMRTLYEHISFQIASILNPRRGKSVLVTGGGTFNSFLVRCIREKTACELVIPGPELVKYKEALVFSFMGILRLRNETNCLASVTGAEHDCSGGIVYHL